MTNSRVDVYASCLLIATAPHEWLRSFYTTNAYISYICAQCADPIHIIYSSYPIYALFLIINLSLTCTNVAYVIHVLVSIYFNTGLYKGQYFEEIKLNQGWQDGIQQKTFELKKIALSA